MARQNTRVATNNATTPNNNTTSDDHWWDKKCEITTGSQESGRNEKLRFGTWHYKKRKYLPLKDDGYSRIRYLFLQYVLKYCGKVAF